MNARSFKKTLSAFTTFMGVAMLLSGCAFFEQFGQSIDPRYDSREQVESRLEVKPPKPNRKSDTRLIQAAKKENERIIASYGGIYSNEAIELLLARLVSKLVANSDYPSQGFQITILNSPAINAFALPGGFLYITRGLLALASDESEVAAVISHEMAHVNARHGQERLKRARNTKVVSDAVKGVFGTQETADLLLAQREIDFAAFSQAQEFQADEIGVRNAGRAGYDPFAASRFLKAMARFQDYRTNSAVNRSDDQRNFLSSHPSTPNRVRQAQLAARQFGAPGVGNQYQQRFLDAIDGLTYGDDPKEGFVRDRTFFHPQLRFTFTVPTGYVIENTSEAVLATATNKDAIRFDGVAVPQEIALADYLASGWLNGLDPSSIKSFTINGAPAASATAAINDWQYRITVIRSEFSTYRMIFATQNVSTAFERAVTATTTSFRTLSEREAKALSPLMIKTTRVKAGDSVRSLSRKMRGLVANPIDAFRALNGLDPAGSPKVGDVVKIVVEAK